jgi:molybdopterin converting factor small subunit
MENLQLPKDQVKVLFVNNTIQRGNYPLSGREGVGIFPPVGGG